MRSRQVPRYRSVEYEPQRYPVQRLDQVSQRLDRREASQRLDRQASKQYSRSLDPDYVPLYEEDERPQYDGPILKKRATRTQALPGWVPVDRPVEPIRPRSRGWGWVIVGALFFLSVYLFLTGVVLPWVQSLENHWTYGQDGVYHMQAYLHQNDSPSDPSDLYAYLSHGLVVVDVVQDKALHSYPLTFSGTNQSGYLVTLEVRDMGNGKPDILVHVGELTVVMWNNGKDFQGTRP